MSDATPHLGLPLIAAAQAQKHVTHNEALGLLDALVQLSCLDKDLSAPPASPSEGDRYLVTAANPTGAWAGLSGQVVRFSDGVWVGTVPRPGWFAYVIDETDLYIFDGAAWTSFRRAITQIQLTTRLGVNTTPDATNRLALKSDAALLSFDDVTPGSGDMRVAVNKQAAARDAAVVFQTGFSARALLGTLGGDDLSLKVSGDGAAFATVLTASPATGGIDFASAETAVAAAATADLGAAGTRRVLVTGAATIASFGVSPNRERFVRFSAAATLSHDATKLVLPTRANILTAADDTCIASSDAAGNWRVRHYQRADGTALVGGVASVAGRTGSVTLAVADVSGAAPLVSPAFTGTPTVPNAAAGTSTQQAASTAFVAASFVTYAYAAATYATAANATLTGTPTAPTPASKDNSTKLATTAYADRGDAAAIARTQVNDAVYTILASDRTVAVIALSGARTLTLPAASAYPQGATLTVLDESGSCSGANALTIACAGASDMLNGASAAVVAQPYGYLALQSNGANKWTIVDAPGNLLAFRNRLRNGAFAVNQRMVSGTVTLAAGTYGHDGWKAGSGGASYTVAAAANGDVTVTGAGSAANTLLQVIEGALYLPEGGAYVLSWIGTATARVYQGSASGSYGAGTPAVIGGQAVNVLPVMGLTVGTNVSVEFNIAGGLSVRLVQFEPGLAATPFERRDDELRRCLRYYRRVMAANDFVPGFQGLNATTAFGAVLTTDVQMRAAATVDLSTASDFGAITAGGSGIAATAITLNVSTPRMTRLDLTTTSGLSAGQAVVLYATTASARLALTAEL